MNHFGEVLREARTRAGLTQKELAEKVGIDDSSISKMEKGVFLPVRKVAVGLADSLGISDPKERNRFKIAAGVFNEEDYEGFALVKVASGQAVIQGQGSQQVSSHSTVLRSQLVPSDQEILIRRLTVMENRLAAAEEMLGAAVKKMQDAREEQRELAALAAEMLKRTKPL